MQKELIVVKGRVIEQKKAYVPELGEDIGFEAGAKMIKNWFDQNPDDVLAYFMGRNIVENILAQPGVVGIRIFNALNELGIKQIVLVGVDKNGNNILEYTTTGENGELIKKKGIVADRSALCPPSCGDNDSTLGWWGTE